MANIRETTYSYQIVNIKLQTNKKGDDKQQAYEQLIRDLVSKQIHMPVAKDKHMIIFSCFSETTENGTKYLYGNLGKGICFEKDIIDNIVINESEMKQENSDRGRIFNSENARYIFIPSVHKFIIILKDTSINATQVLKFFSKSLTQVADKEDIVEVEVVKDPKITTEILNAFELHRLSYTISYTNDDPNEPISDLFDKRLKRRNIGKLSVDIQADNKGAINKDEPDELIQGGVMLAEQNGVINEALITRSIGDKKTKLSNQNKPRTLSVIGNINTYTSIIISDVCKLFGGLL